MIRKILVISLIMGYFTHCDSLLNQYDVTTITAVLQKEIPNLKINSIIIIPTGWDHLVAEVNENLIFRFPREKKFVNNLEREKQLLEHLKGCTKLAIPSYKYFGNNPAFAGYPKIPGRSLNRQLYISLDFDTRYRIAQSLASFFTELHQEVSTEQAINLGYSRHSLEIDKIKSELLGTIPNDIDMMVKQAIAYSTTTESNQTDEDLVFLHNDVHDDNIAFNANTQQINGIFDFSDAAIGPSSAEFSSLFFIHEELAQLTAKIYAQLNNISNQIIKSAADYILRNANRILLARAGNMHLTPAHETKYCKRLKDFIPIWQEILDSSIKS